jgi:hypothetical protein
MEPVKATFVSNCEDESYRRVGFNLTFKSDEEQIDRAVYFKTDNRYEYALQYAITEKYADINYEDFDPKANYLIALFNAWRAQVKAHGYKSAKQVEFNFVADESGGFTVETVNKPTLTSSSDGLSSEDDFDKPIETNTQNQTESQQDIFTEEEASCPPNSDAQTPWLSNIGMLVLGGFITALGVIAVALAFAVLASIPVGVGILAAAGIVSIAVGLGFFALGTKGCVENNEECGLVTLNS